MTRIKLEFSCETPNGTDGLVVYSLTGNLIGSPEAYAFQDDVRSKVAGGLQKIVIDLEFHIDQCVAHTIDVVSPHIRSFIDPLHVDKSCNHTALTITFRIYWR